jgi:hypothetical protein
MSRIQIEVAYDSRHYDIDANINDRVSITGYTDRNRDELFAEIDRSVAKIKAAIREGE